MTSGCSDYWRVFTLLLSLAAVTANEYGTATLVATSGVEHPPLVKGSIPGLTLTCTDDPTAKKIPFGSKYNFYKNGEKLMHLIFGDYSLSVVTDDITGTYSCDITVSGETTPRSNQVALLFVAPPVLQDISDSINLGGTMSLMCLSDMNTSEHPYTYEWFNGDTKLSTTGENLIVSDLESSDEGEYSCRLLFDNDFTSDKSNVYEITFAAPPVPSLEAMDSDSPNPTVLRGRRLTLECFLEDETKYSIVKKAVLYLDGSKVAEKQTTRRTRFLSDVTARDAGSYTCSFANDIAESPRSGPVQVQVTEWTPGQMTTDLMEEERKSAENFDLTCVEEAGEIMDFCTLYYNQNSLMETSSCSFTVNRYLDGNYSCSGSSLSVESQRSTPSILKFITRPHIVPVSALPTQDGENMTLRCETTGASIPDSQFNWFLGDNTHVSIGGSQDITVERHASFHDYIRCRIKFRDSTFMFSQEFNFKYSEISQPFITKGLLDDLPSAQHGVVYQNLYCNGVKDDEEHLYDYSLIKNDDAQVATHPMGQTMFTVFQPINYGEKFGCKAFNKFNSSVASSNIYVQARDEVTISSSLAQVILGQRFELDCTTSLTDVTFKWKIVRAGSDKEEIQDGKKLTFSSLSRSNEGLYTCQAVSDERILSSNIQYPITFSVPSVPKIDNTARGMGLVFPDSGSQIHYVFKCTCEGLFCNPNDPFRLYKDGSLVELEDNQFSDYVAFGMGSYTVNRTFSVDISVTENDGTYVCTSLNYVGESDPSNDLVIASPSPAARRPYVVVFSTPHLGHNTRLRCMTEASEELIQWIKDNVPLFRSGRNLDLNTLTMADQGAYLCRVAPPGTINQNVYISDPYMLALENPIQPTLTFIDDQTSQKDIGVNIMYAEGQDAFVKCFSNYQEISQQYNEKLLVPDRSFSLLKEGQTVETNTLGVFMVSVVSSTSYTCVINDPVGSSDPSWPLTLTVADSPTITTNTEIRLGARNFVLTCNAPGSNGHDIIWEKNGNQIAGDTLALQLTSRLSYADEGRYTCRRRSGVVMHPRSPAYILTPGLTRPTVFTQLETKVKAGSFLTFYCIGTANTATNATLYITSDNNENADTSYTTESWLDDVGQILFRFNPHRMDPSQVVTCTMANSLGNSVKSFEVPISVLDKSGCFAGSYVVNDGCNLCAVGTYQNQQDQNVCLNCPTGMTTASTGSRLLSDCFSESANPHWSNWSEYGACSVECGGGQQVRTRLCPRGVNCPGLNTDTKSCNQEACPGIDVGLDCTTDESCKMGLVCGSISKKCACENSMQWYNADSMSCQNKLNHLDACGNNAAQKPCQSGYICSASPNNVNKCLCDPVESSYIDAEGKCKNLNNFEANSISDSGTTEVTWGWDKISSQGQEATYKVKLTPDKDNCLSITEGQEKDGEVQGNKLTVKFISLSPGIKYLATLTINLEATADYPARSGDVTLKDTYTRPAVPGEVDISSSNLKSGVTRLLFMKSEGCVAFYRVIITTLDNTNPVEPETVNGRLVPLEAVFYGLEPNTNYTYTIKAINPVGGESRPTNGMFRTQSDVTTCEDKPCQQECENIPSGVRCSCTTGFKQSLTDSSKCDDINECDNSTACTDNQLCNNKFGSYECVGIIKRNFEMTFANVEFPSTSEKQTEMINTIKTQTNNYFRTTLDGYVTLEVTIRNGSVIALVVVTIDETNTNRDGTLLDAVTNLQQHNFTLGQGSSGQNADAITINNRVLSSTMSKCELRAAVYPCADNEECKEENGVSKCTEKPPTDYTGVYVGVAIGAVVLLIIIVVVIVMMFKRRKNHNKKYKASSW